jgi:hypothetical protein
MHATVRIQTSYKGRSRMRFSTIFHPIRLLPSDTDSRYKLDSRIFTSHLRRQASRGRSGQVGVAWTSCCCAGLKLVKAASPGRPQWPFYAARETLRVWRAAAQRKVFFPRAPLVIPNTCNPRSQMPRRACSMDGMHNSMPPVVW